MTGDTSERLRETLETLAEQVAETPPDAAYKRVRAEWRRRERRRRIVMALIAVAVIAAADAAALWALNSGPAKPSIVYDDSTTPPGEPRLPVGQL